MGLGHQQGQALHPNYPVHSLKSSPYLSTTVPILLRHALASSCPFSSMSICMYPLAAVPDHLRSGSDSIYQSWICLIGYLQHLSSLVRPSFLPVLAVENQKIFSVEILQVVVHQQVIGFSEKKAWLFDRSTCSTYNGLFIGSRKVPAADRPGLEY